MFSFFGLLEPYEYKRVKTIIFSLIDKYSDISKTEISSFMLFKLKLHKKGLVNAVKGEHVPATRAASFFLLNGLFELISSGQYHVYRGTLSAIGRDMLSVYTKLSSQLVEDGLQTEGEAITTLGELDEEVKAVG